MYNAEQIPVKQDSFQSFDFRSKTLAPLKIEELETESEKLETGNWYFLTAYVSYGSIAALLAIPEKNKRALRVVVQIERGQLTCRSVGSTLPYTSHRSKKGAQSTVALGRISSSTANTPAVVFDVEIRG